MRPFAPPLSFESAALKSTATACVGFETQEVREFKEAVGRFKHDIPTIVVTLRGMIVGKGKKRTPPSASGAARFLDLCSTAINPALTVDDVDEMLIQHILTEEIFISIFGDMQILDENNIACEQSPSFSAPCACAN